MMSFLAAPAQEMENRREMEREGGESYSRIYIDGSFTLAVVGGITRAQKHTPPYSDGARVVRTCRQNVFLFCTESRIPILNSSKTACTHCTVNLHVSPTGFISSLQNQILTFF